MYYDYYESELIGRLKLVGDEKGLRYIGFEKEKHPVAIESDWIRNPDFFAPVKAQLSSYFNGTRTRFDLPLAPEGTAFQLKVWRALRNIPYGEVVSYKVIAETIGQPQAVRAVGGANGKNPIPIIVPCHRVIGCNGTLTGFGGGLDVKQRLIDHEKNTRSKTA